MGNMIADVFVMEVSRAKAESRLKEHIEQAGWRIEEIQHCELVQGVPVHDSRLGGLIKLAKQNQIASQFSPYGDLDHAPESAVAADAPFATVIAPAPRNPAPSSVEGPMKAETPPPEQPAKTLAPVEVPPPPKLVNPHLSGALMADHAALENDLLQAQELAADFQKQLAGKSNECALLKQLIEKTQSDLGHLQDGIVQLRAERHRLANEAMKVQALEAIRSSLERKLEEQAGQTRERDRRIAELVIETVRLRQLVDQVRDGAAAPPKPVTPQKRDLEIEDDIEITTEAPRPVRLTR